MRMNLSIDLVCRLLTCCVLAVSPAGGFAQEPPLPAETVARLNDRLAVEIADLTARVEKSPRNVELYSQRGDRLFFQGKFAEAVADFDKMVELDPGLKESHWRRGIACFYAGKHDEAAHQFEIYHSFDNIDRENGIWRYLSQVKSVGRDEARQGLLKYEKDDRAPFPQIYRMFSGELEGDKLLEEIRQADLPAAERTKQLFYAELYVGLNEAVEGRLETAEKHLRESTANTWGSRASGGPGWMWHVGRVHYNLLREARLRKEADAKP